MGASQPSAAPAWSHTRYGMLRDCPRRYYYHYYLARGGARRGADSSARRAYALKSLTSLDLVLGIAVHGCARRLANAAGAQHPLPTEAALWKTLRDALNGVCASSGDRALFLRDPSRSAMLREVYYGGSLARATVDRVRDKAILCLRSLCHLPLWGTLRQARRGSIRRIDAPVRFRVDGIEVWAAPDLVYHLPDEGHVVVDWKTGQTREAAELEQVSVYGLYLRRAGLCPEDADPTARVFALRSGGEAAYVLTGDRLAAAEARIRTGAGVLRRAHDAVDRLGPEAIHAFPLTSHRVQCSRCNFFELCDGELRPLSLADGEPGLPSGEPGEPPTRSVRPDPVSPS